MLFNSIEFLIFFPIVVMLYFVIPHKYRWILLLAASYYFYMCWKAEYAILLVISTMIDYYAGIMMEKTESKKKRRKFLILSLLSNLGLLFTFKYYNFFSTSIVDVLNYYNIFYESPTFKLLLPVGISFYTFQTMSYSIDVYRGERKAEHHFGYFALFVTFFPQLVAGPIERSTNLMPQFFEKHEFDAKRVSDGLKLMMWGFFKKVVIADRLAVLVNQVYNNAESYEGFTLLLATYFFAFQIYCDFSGYSDIARGSAQVMGFKLMLNFDRPYLSRSVSEFWQRWHISLSSWFRDYVYITLGGNRVSKLRWSANIMATFILSGLWHGSNWTFIAWGALNGFYLLCSHLTVGMRKKVAYFFRLNRLPTLNSLIQIGYTFFLICLSWIFFRADSISDAIYIVDRIWSGFWLDVHSLTWQKLLVVDHLSAYSFLGSQASALKVSTLELSLSIVFIVLLIVIQWFQGKINVQDTLTHWPGWFRWSLYYLLVMVIILGGIFGNKQFIYFQF